MLKLNMMDSHIKVQSAYINMRMIVYKVYIGLRTLFTPKFVASLAACLAAWGKVPKLTPLSHGWAGIQSSGQSLRGRYASIVILLSGLRTLFTPKFVASLAACLAAWGKVPKLTPPLHPLHPQACVLQRCRQASTGISLLIKYWLSSRI